MEINLTLCNFSKFINFITSIDGDLNGASIEYIVDTMYDDTWDNCEDGLANSMEGSIADMLKIVKAAMQKKRVKNTSISYEDDKYCHDTINVWMKLDNNPMYVLSLSKAIYEEKIKNWLALNAKSITMNV